MTNIIHLAVGTNLGNREQNLQDALKYLPPQVDITAISQLYETAPAYVLDQPAFLNIALKGTTSLLPVELLTYLKEIEADIGREKSFRFGPRKIDLDIIFFNDLVLDIPNLQIPHPKLHERGFVLRPLVDLDPLFIHPALQQTVSQLLADLPQDDGIMTVSMWSI